MPNSKKEDISSKPKPGAGDYAHTIARAGLSMIPVFGGAAKEIFTAIVNPPLAKRRDDWIESIVGALQELETTVDDLKIEKLSQNESFITIVTHATIIALRNHQKEKIEALRNAVLNKALSSEPDEDLQLMFLNFVDSFTPSHLRILKYFDNPEEWFRVNDRPYPDVYSGGASHYLEMAFPELKGNREFYDQLANDLSNRGLMKNGESIHAVTTKHGMLMSRTTAMGKKFLRFISSPIQLMKH